MSWAAPIIGLGGALGGALLGSKKSAEEKALTTTQTQALQQQMALAKEQEARSNAQWGMASPIYQNLISYYQQQAANPYKAIAPSIEDQTRRTYGMEQQIRQDLPRGGAADLAMAQNRLSLTGLPQQMAQQYQNQAYSQLAGLGSSLMGQSGTGLGQASSTYGSLLPYKGPQQNALAGVVNQTGNMGMQALMEWLKQRKTNPSTAPIANPWNA